LSIVAFTITTDGVSEGEERGDCRSLASCVQSRNDRSIFAKVLQEKREDYKDSMSIGRRKVAKLEESVMPYNPFDPSHPN